MEPNNGELGLGPNMILVHEGLFLVSRDQFVLGDERVEQRVCHNVGNVEEAGTDSPLKEAKG